MAGFPSASHSILEIKNFAKFFLSYHGNGEIRNNLFSFEEKYIIIR